MKKIITIMLFVLIESFTLILFITLYQSNKQVLIANEIFNNTIETLRSRNFSKKAIHAVTTNNNFKFHIDKVEPYKYKVSMDYRVDFQTDKKTIRTFVYQQK